MLRKTLISVSLSAIFMLTGLSQASNITHDIDIFLAPSSSTGNTPNVLFVIDNAASWNSNMSGMTKKEMVMEALHEVLTHEDFRGKVNVGLMPFAHGNKDKGGTVLVHAKYLDIYRQEELSCRLYSTAPGADGICPVEKGKEVLEQGNNAPYAMTISEAYLYFKGEKPKSGEQDGVFSSSNLRGYDPEAIIGGLYNSPSKDTPCAKNFIVVIGTGNPDSSENTPATAALIAHEGDPTPITLPSDANNYESSMADEYARFLRNLDLYTDVDGKQFISTYVIDVHAVSANPNKPYKSSRALFNSIAEHGGGGTAFSVQTKADMIKAVTDILQEVQSVNTVFASVSLPISVNVQGTNANQVYIGMFRPDVTKSPRWMGNVKRYQYLFNNGQPYLAGQDGEPAYNAATGFIRQDAVSYWTKASKIDEYWKVLYPKNRDDLPDGEVVEKGAAAQRLRERNNARMLRTCTKPCNNLVEFNAANTGLGSNLVSWVIGDDISNESGHGDVNISRPSIHGDVLHSRPAVVNYNRSDNGDDDVVVFYGSNDGVFRAVHGDTGEELWGLILPEHFGLLDEMYFNDIRDADVLWRPYAVDGNPTVIVLDKDNNRQIKAADGDKVYLYLTMRRGGRMIYALDVSVPESPVLLWRKDNSSPGYAELGQTWSSPVPAYVKGGPLDAENNPVPVLIFGLGYDAEFEDQTSSLPIDKASVGRGIMVVNALTGEPIWQAGPSPSGATYNKTVSDMAFSIPSEVRLVNRSGNSEDYAEYIYVGDTGGSIWRVDIRDANPANWTVTQMASVGGCTNKLKCRKFLYPPSIVFGPDYDAVLIGSGDREKPADDTITNRFYMFKDTKSAAAIKESDMLDVTNTLTEVDGAVLDSKLGWYFTLETGEKVVGNPVTLSGITIFNTNKPASKDASVTSCSGNLGEARQYQINYLDGSTIGGTADRFVTVPGGGYPPPPVPMTLIDPKTDKPWTGLGGLDPVSPGGSSYGRRVRTFWFKDAD